VRTTVWAGRGFPQLHVGSFTPEGSFTAAAAALEHVAALGFTGIQLMPCTEFGGAWGYNPRQLMTVHSPWGSADDLRRYVCHSSPVPPPPCAFHVSGRRNWQMEIDGNVGGKESHIDSSSAV
jgi:hypothetical protein